MLTITVFYVVYVIKCLWVGSVLINRFMLDAAPRPLTEKDSALPRRVTDVEAKERWDGPQQMSDSQHPCLHMDTANFGE